MGNNRTPTFTWNTTDTKEISSPNRNPECFSVVAERIEISDVGLCGLSRIFTWELIRT